ncbi:MAG: leucyl aminopeptidase [Solirubrobacteraceae bacterium]|nr:leucyl aminopeptidase [Solirubrobacteraceae bacterium]
MRVTTTTQAPVDTAADTVAIGVFEGEDVAHDLDGAPLQALLDSGEARRTLKHLALTHAAGRRWLVVGLGARDDFDAERARAAAATVVGRLGELGTRTLCWELPHRLDEAQVGGFVEGTLLAAHRFDRYRAAPPEDETPARVEELIVSDHHDVSAPVERAVLVAEAQNRARDLAATPPNDLTPQTLAERARELAAEHAALSVAVLGRDGIAAAGMGAFAAVTQGSDAEPALITLRHEPADGDGYDLGLVGKAVTFDSGGLSIKPAASMATMKFDMAGGAAVLEAVGAIAALGLPVRVVAVVGATENMPSGRAMRPGDVVRARTGTTIEIVNTDAEGRLVLADCLAHARELGARRLVDLATLTGAILSALGHHRAGLFADDDAWAAAVERAAAATGELVWRMPLDPEYGELIESPIADLVNAGERGLAGSITAAEFLRRFTGDVPWAHVDIAGTAWDLGRPYAAKGASGWGVRLLVDLARAVAGE